MHTDIKITNNTKMDHIIVSFSDHYNSIFIDRVCYKHKTWQFHGILINPFHDKSIFSSYAQNYFFSLKMWKKITSPPQVTSWNIQDPALKIRVSSFS